MTAAGHFRCSKNFPHAGTGQAVELLLVRAPYGTDWSVKPRCTEHPAADDIPMIGRASPDSTCVIVPLDGAR